MNGTATIPSFTFHYSGITRYASASEEISDLTCTVCTCETVPTALVHVLDLMTSWEEGLNSSQARPRSIPLAHIERDSLGFFISYNEYDTPDWSFGPALRRIWRIPRGADGEPVWPMTLDVSQLMSLEHLKYWDPRLQIWVVAISSPQPCGMMADQFVGRRVKAGSAASPIGTTSGSISSCVVASRLHSGSWSCSCVNDAPCDFWHSRKNRHNNNETIVHSQL